MSAGLAPRARLGVALHLIASPDNVEAPERLLALAGHAVRSASLDFVELGPVSDAEARADLSHRLRTAGLEVIFHTGPVAWAEGLDLGDAEATRRTAAVRRVAGLLEQAGDLGAALIQVSPGPDRADRPDALERTARSIGELCRAAAPVPIACELYDRDAFARRLIGPSNEAGQLVESVGEPNFGLLLDTSHLLLQGEDPGQAAARLGSHVLHAHIANCVTDPAAPRAGDEHPYFGVHSGAVSAEIAAAFVQALAGSGYFDDPARGRIGAEVKLAPGEDPEAALFNGARFARRAIGLASAVAT